MKLLKTKANQTVTPVECYLPLLLNKAKFNLSMNIQLFEITSHFNYNIIISEQNELKKFT